jgi:hypothetical protein
MSPVRSSLQIKQLCIAPIELHQLCVRATFANLTVFNHKDTISQTHSTEAMTNENSRPTLCQMAKTRKDLMLGRKLLIV